VQLILPTGASSSSKACNWPSTLAVWGREHGFASLSDRGPWPSACCSRSTRSVWFTTGQHGPQLFGSRHPKSQWGLKTPPQRVEARAMTLMNRSRSGFGRMKAKRVGRALQRASIVVVAICALVLSVNDYASSRIHATLERKNDHSCSSSVPSHSGRRLARIERVDRISGCGGGHRF
jgi:hypothetical protein